MGFTEAFDRTLPLEGDFVDDPNDSGGATKYGITERLARAHGYAGEMRDLSEPEARRIAKAEFWDVLRLDEIALISLRTAEELFDTGYNCGPSTAARFLQTCLNVLNRAQEFYPDIAIDGVIGPKTVFALNAFIRIRYPEGERVLLCMLNCLQGAFYIDLASRREKDEKFVYGWILNRVVT